jgi:cation diffusion facilitator CzcD-associated flavoprotein CzcO
MTDESPRTPDSEREPLAPLPGAPAPIDRRSFFRQAAMLAVAGSSASAALAQVAGPSGEPSNAARGAPASGGAPSGPPTGAGASELEAQTGRVLRWAGREPADWVRARSGVDHNVVIVGAGHSGVAIAYALKRKGVGRVDVVDQSEPGQAGIWRNIARMHQLRTPKALMPGPEGGNVALSFRAWYETLNGPGAFDALDRIPRLAWADYLAWFQQATDTKVRYRTRLLEIEPQGDVLRLHLESGGEPRVETTRKLVLANGYAGAGGASVPDFVRALPSDVWTHTTGRIPVETLRGKIVGIIGAGSNAFDAAAVALEAGASEVHVFSRRSYIDIQGSAPPPAPQAASQSAVALSAPSQPAAQPAGSQPPPARPAPAPVDRGYPNWLELNYELPDVVRWRNFLLGDRRVASVPLDSIERAVAFENFHIHLDTSLADVALAGNRKVVAKAGRKTLRFDYLIAATGYRIDLAAQPELALIHEHIALWRDRYRPAPGEESAAGGNHPYLGAGFEFLPRGETGRDFLRNIHCFNLAGALSFGIPVGDVPSMVYHPRLVSAIARDLYLESVDTAVHERFINAPLVPPDPAPYQRAVEGRAREVA